MPACYVAYLLGVALGPAQSPNPIPQAKPDTFRLGNGFEVEAADLDIGEVWEDPAYVRSVNITNRGPAASRVTNMSGGCECTSIEPKAFTIAPEQSQVVKVKIDLTHRYPHQFGMDRRELSLTIFPTLTDRGVSADCWKVTGIIKSRVSLESRGLAFADLCGQGGPSVTRKMRATAHMPLAGLEASMPRTIGKAEVRAVPGQPNKYDILVTPNPDRPLGAFRYDVAVTAVSPDGEKSACAAFYVEGEVVSPVRIVPGPVLLGEHPVGTKAEAVVSVHFPAAGWSVERTETERTDTTVTPIEMLDGRPTFQIVQLITTPGDQSCQVRFVGRKPGGQLETVAVTVTYHGETPKKEATP